MSINKFANDFFFHDENTVKNIILGLSSVEYNAYISALSQIHEVLRTEDLELEDAILDVIGPKLLDRMKTLINAIGEVDFISNEFAETSSALSSIKDKKQSPVLPQPIDKKTLNQPPTTESTVLEPVVNVNTDLSAETLAKLNPVARQKYLSLLKFNKDDLDLSNKLLNDIHEIELQLAMEEDSSNHSILIDDLTLAIIDLQELSSLYEDETVINDSKISEKLKNIKKDLPADISDDDGNEIQNDFNDKFKATSVNTREHGAKLSPSKYLSHQIFKINTSFREFTERNSEQYKNPYIDLSVYPPKFNDDAQSILGELIKLTDEIYSESITDGNKIYGSDASHGRKSELVSKFNTLIYVVKHADQITFDALRSKIKHINSITAEELGETEETKEAIKREYEKIYNRFTLECATQKIFDPEYFDLNKLYYCAIYLSSPRLGYFLLFDDSQKSLYNEQNNAPRLKEEDFDIIKELIDKFSYTTFLRKAKEYFNLLSRTWQKNFIQKISLSWNTVFFRVYSRYYESGPQYTYASCPTCFKMVPWSYSKDAKKRDESYAGFRIRPISFYTNNPQKPKITLNELKSRKWPAPPANMFNSKDSEREKKLMVAYQKAGEKSWDEIQSLIYSNKPELHEEGIHRRNGALLAAGGAALTTTDLLIKNIQTECPFESKSGNSCGASFSEQTNLEPKWNGILDKGISNIKTELKEDLWTDKEKYNKAKKLQSGGFKFSKVNFACTCHISEINEDMTYKYGYVAISKIGPVGTPGFVYPTKPDGLLNTDLEKDTLTFVVCGASTSLSSVDRNPESTGFILKYLKDLRDTSVKDYIEMTSILIRYGFDLTELMELDQNLDNFVTTTGVEKISIDKRFSILNDLLYKAAAIKLDEGNHSEKRRLLSGLTLVCPFGHKFNVGHSLLFGKTYSGVKNTIRHNSALKGYGFKNSYLLTGINNIIGLKRQGVIMRANSKRALLYENKYYYDEWTKFKDRVVYPTESNPELPLLMFRLNDEDGTNDYIFSYRLKTSTDDIWSPDKSIEQPVLSSERYLETDESSKGAVSLESEIDGKNVSLADKNVAQSWNIDEDVIEYNNRKSKVFIPGTIELEDDTGINMKAWDMKISAFAKTLKSILKIIVTYTKGLVSNTMMNALLSEYKIDVSVYKSDIMRILIPNLTFDDGDGNELEHKDIRQLIAELENHIIDVLNRKTNSLIEWIKNNIHLLPEDDIDKKIAFILIKDAVSTISNSNSKDEFDSAFGIVSFKGDNPEETVDLICKKIITNIPSLVKELTLESQGYYQFDKERNQYDGRIIMVGYAQYLAYVLSLLYRKYCYDVNSPNYIGYNIGIDLSTPEKIIGYEDIDSNGVSRWINGVSESDILKITDTLKKAMKISPSMSKPVTPGTLEYGHRIDIAWKDFKDNYMAKAKKQAVTARAMELSKDFIISRISHIFSTSANFDKTNLDTIKYRIENSLPSKTLLFSDTTENPETAPTLVTKKRLPFISKSRLITEHPGTVQVEEWILRNTLVKGNLVFATEQDAKNYLNNMSQETRYKGNWIIEQDNYWKNDQNGYDGSKIQVGVMSPKVDADFKWPPDPGCMDFVGINLPFRITNNPDNSVNRLKFLPILSHRIIIDFDGSPLDISFLVKKGSDSDSDLAEISDIEDFIIKARKDCDDNIMTFSQKNSKQISENDRLLSDYKQQQEEIYKSTINEAMNIIENKPLYISTKSSYYDVTQNKARPIPRICIEDPLRAYKLICHPECRGVSIEPDDKERLIKFICNVYSLNVIRDIARNLGGDFASLNTRDLLENSSINFKKVGPRLKDEYVNINNQKRFGWKEDPGTYYNVEPGEKNSDTGSYLQYIYKSTQSANRRSGSLGNNHPDILALVSVSSQYNKVMLDGDKDNTKQNKTMINKNLSTKLQSVLLSYIENELTENKQNGAIDQISKLSSLKYNYKIFQRNFELERIILSAGEENFADVTIPNF